MPHDFVPWTVTAFRKNRRATWNAVRWCAGPLVLGIMGFCVPLVFEWEQLQQLGQGHSITPAYMPLGKYTLGLMLSLALIVTAGIGAAVAVRRHYKCPQCSSVPMGGRSVFGSVDFRPSACGDCGARLS